MSGHRRFAPESHGTTGVLIGLVALGAISTDLYLPSLPSIGRDLGADIARTQLTLGVFLAAFALAQLVLGPLSDRFGRRPVLLAGAAIYTAASIACALAQSIDALIVARGVQAIGACAGVVIGRAVVRDIYGRERAARMLAYISSAMALLPAFGPIVGGVVEVWLGWRWNFVILAGFGSIVLLGTAGGLAETNAWRDPAALAPQRLVANYARLLSNRSFIGFALAVAFSYAGLFTFISGSSFVIIDALGVPPDRFGYFFAGAVAGYITGTQIAGKFTLKLGIERMVLMGARVGVAGGLAMAIVAWSGWVGPGMAGAVTLVIPMAVFMVGIGIVMPNANAGAIGPFATMAGAASAVVGFLQMSIAAVIGVVFGQLHDGSPRPMASLIAAMSLLVLFCAHGLARSRRQTPAGDD